MAGVFLLGVALILAAWQLAAAQTVPLVLPSPYDTLLAAKELLVSGALMEEVHRTLSRTLVGFAWGSAAGITLGLVTGRFRYAFELLRPLHTALLGAPPIVVVVIALIWFGTGGAVPVFVVGLLIFPIVYLNTAEGWRNLDRGLLEMSSVYGRPLRRTLAAIILPGLAVPVLSGLSLAAGFALRIAIMAELLASNSGIGHSIALARVNIQTDRVFAWTLISIALLVGVDYLLIRPFKARINRWNAPSA